MTLFLVADSRVSPAEVVNHVAKLLSSRQQSTELPNLLGAADLDRSAQRHTAHS